MRTLAIVMLVAGIASADDAPALKVEVEVGKTVERNVGYARGGWFCDDATLLTAELVTRGDANFWIVTGAKPGKTQCRVGNDLHRVAYVFDVVVTAGKQKAH